MARNGSGVYSLPAGNPVITGTTISSTWANSTLNDIASALTASLTSDGQTTPTANLPMGGYVLSGVGSATLRTQSASAGQIQDSVFQYLTGISGTDTIVATAALGMTAYAAGQVFRFISAGANTGAVTLNINAIGAKAITKNGTVGLVADDIVADAVIQVVYDGTQFQLLSGAGSGGGATGGGSDEIFIENDQTVTTSYSIPATKNAMSTGPITIDSGATVTVPSGSRWVIL
jgi:hypothetical protein